MTNSMEKLLENFRANVSNINHLLSLGVIDMNEFVDSVIETKNRHLIHDVARNIKNVPVERLVDALVDLFSSNSQKSGNWDYLLNIAIEVENAPFNKIVDILIQKSTVDEEAAIQLPKLLGTQYDQDKLINAIIASKSFYAMSTAQKILNYKNDVIISSLLKSNEQDNMLFRNLFNTIANGDSKYIPELVIHMKEVFPEKYLFILLHPNAIFKMEKSLDEEESKSNSQYLNILYSFLKKALKQLEKNNHRYDYLRIISEHHDYLFSPNHVSLEEWNKIFVSCKNIINKIEVNSAFIQSLDEDKKFEHLMSLCERGIFEPITNNLEEFQSLFQSAFSEVSSQKEEPKVKKLTQQQLAFYKKHVMKH